MYRSNMEIMNGKQFGNTYCASSMTITHAGTSTKGHRSLASVAVLALRLNPE